MGIITDILKDIPLSAVLRERLVDQEKKMAILEAENLALKNENSNLKAIVENLRQEIQQTKDIQKEKSHGTLLDEAKINILKLLFEQDKLPTEEIAQILSYAIQTTKFHLEELKLNQMLKDIPYTRNRKPVIGWYLQQEGRRYLIENKITSQQGAPSDAQKIGPR